MTTNKVNKLKYWWWQIRFKSWNIKIQCNKLQCCRKKSKLAAQTWLLQASILQTEAETGGVHYKKVSLKIPQNS